MERAERIAFVELSDGHNESFRPVVQNAANILRTVDKLSECS
jgi:hypothetical protein